MNANEFNIDGYNLQSCNIENDTGRGVILYTHVSQDVTPLTPKTQFQEPVWLEIKLNKFEKMIVGCIYRSDSETKENNEKLKGTPKGDGEHESHSFINNG